MKKTQRGQATVEFILTFVFGLSLMLMIFNSAMNYVTGYLVHYATFMAGRVYLTAETYFGVYGRYDQSINIAEQRARSAFQQYNLGVFGIKADEFFVNNSRSGQTSSEYLTVGVYSRFSQKVDVLGKIAGNTELDLVSEAFLGKEPSRSACATRVCFAMTGSESCEPTFDITLFDDGC